MGEERLFSNDAHLPTARGTDAYSFLLATVNH